MHYQAPCWKFTSVGRLCARGLCMPLGEGVAIRECQFSQWVPRTELSLAGLEESTFILWGILLSPAHVFSVLRLFFFLCLFSGPPLVSRHCYTEKQGYQITSAWAVGLGSRLAHMSNGPFMQQSGEDCPPCNFNMMFILSSRYFFRSTWTFTYVPFSLDGC